MSGPASPIVQERVVVATPEEVFRAWGDAESLSRWMCPGGVTRAQVEVDFRVGGRFRIVMHGAEAYAHHGEYLVIDPPRELVFTWVSEWLPEPVRRTRVRVTLEPVGVTRTRIRLVHDALPPGDTYAGHVQGWADILQKLEVRLGAGRGGTP